MRPTFGRCGLRPSPRECVLEVPLGNPVLRHFSAIDFKDRDLQAVAFQQVPVRRDVDDPQCEPDAGSDAVDDLLHLVTEMTAWFGVQHEERARIAHATAISHAMACAAARGSGAVMIGRPTTM